MSKTGKDADKAKEASAGARKEAKSKKASKQQKPKKDKKSKKPKKSMPALEGVDMTGAPRLEPATAPGAARMDHGIPLNGNGQPIASSQEFLDVEDSPEGPVLVQPTPDNPDPHGIFIDQVQRRNKTLRQIISFTHSSTKAAGVMLVAAIVALVVANTGAYDAFVSFWNTHVVVGVGSFHGEMSFAHIINDIFMAIFFLLVGLEIKYEMTAGELTNIRQAILPILGAAGGVCAPICIYLLFNASHPEAVHGWGVPTATDIAFALGILALLGSRVPNGVRVFLSTLAVADDIIAILVIAVFYGESPDFVWLGAAAAVFLVLVAMNRLHVYSLVPYMLVGCVLWVCVFMSGIHSTISGVLLAFVIPSGSNVNLQNFLSWSGDRVRLAGAFYDGDNTPLVAQKKYITTVSSISRVSKQAVPPATRLEQALYPWVYFAILPLFALTNADVSFEGLDVATMVSSPVVLGVFCGLVLGKPIGIMLFSFITVKTKIASLPANVNWMHMLGASILGGVGFTMAIFVANLAYSSDVLITEAKLSILMASLVAGIVGFTLLFFQAKVAERQGVSYVSTHEDNENLSHHEREAAQQRDKMIEELDDADLEAELKRVREDALGTRELRVERHHDEGE